MMAVDVHRVELVTHTEMRAGRRQPVAFRGVCSCGARSALLPNAGMVSGWDAAHREEVGDL